MSSLSGQTIGNYEILEEIGRGGMATVYRARQGKLNRTVAIKILPEYLTHEPTFLQRFKREVQLVARLQHARILPVFDYGEIEGMPYIAMAYMPGGTLQDRLAVGPMKLEHTLHFTRQIAEGLEFLHKNGVVHRDFKPSNVLLDKSGNAFIADFGIAKFAEGTASDLTGQSLIGTPQYIAPEMYEHRETAPSVDIYAFGVTVYQMLAGVRPYDSSNPISLMYAHLFSPIPDICEANPSLPPSIQRVIHTAMAKDPAYRYPTAADLANALQQAVDPGNEPYHLDLLEPLPIPERRQPGTPEAVTMPVEARGAVHTTVSGKPRNIRQRSRWWFAGVGLGVVVLAGAVAGAMTLFSSEEDQPEVVSPPTTAQSSVDTPASPTESEPLVTAPPATMSASDPVDSDVPTVSESFPVLAFNALGQGYQAVVCEGDENASCEPRLDSIPQVDGSNSIILGWSPDGEWQILSAETDRELVIRRVEDETILPIASDVSVAAWSPDAASVAYIQAGELWIGEVSCLLSASENCARQETQTDATVEDVAWSYNGQTLFYLQRQSNSFRRLYALQPENGTATALTSTELDIKQVVSLPASTKLLVVDSSRTGGTGGVYFYDIGLSLLDPEDESLTRLVTFSRNQFGTECRGGLCPGGGTVSFSPDGDLVAVTFTAQSDQAQSLYVLNLACLEATTDACNYSTSNPYWSAVATDNGADAGYPSWSSDGSLLSYIQARRTDFDHAVDSSGRNIGGDVYVVRIDRDGETIVTGVPVQVTSLGFVDFKFALWRLY